MVANTNGSLLYVLFSTKAFVSPNGILGRVATIRRLGAVDIWHRETLLWLLLKKGGCLLTIIITIAYIESPDTLSELPFALLWLSA